MPLSRFIKIFTCADDDDRVILYSTSRGAAIRVQRTLLDSISDGSIGEENYKTLERLGFLVTHGDEEKVEILETFQRANRLGTKFTAQVILNLDCNLACTYCYEGGMKGRRYMSKETAELLAAMAENKYIAHGKGVELSFYGGEPLMSQDLILYLSRRLKAATAGKDEGYSFNMVTNGTLLTASVAERLITLGFTGVKVTLDGPRENHDRFRPFISGKGSFDTIIANLKETCDLIDVQIGGNYTIDNFREFPRLLDFLLAAGLTPGRISLVKFDPVIKSGGNFPPPEFNEGCASIDEPWLAEAGLYLREEIMKRGFHTPRIGPAGCMIENPDDLVVNWDGTLFKCPALLGWKEMSIGDLESGIGDYRESHYLDVWKKEECLDCAYLPLCFGGCRFLKKLNNGVIDDVDCRKGYLDENLEELVRQDLKYQPKRSPK